MFVLVNLKAYETDPDAIVEAAGDVAAGTDARIGVAPQIASIAHLVDGGPEIWAQHVSPTGYGSYTGSTLAEAVAGAGAVGTLINHSERRLKLHAIEEAIHRADAAGLETVVCANTPAQIEAVAALGPDMVAVEPPALIGTGTPVSQADPEIVSEAVAAAARIDPEIPVLCGAGISEGSDVAAAGELGADGVLLASGVAKADDPTAVLADLVAAV